MSRNHSRQKIEELVRIFAKEHTEKLNEAETRLRFIDPFFEALGWNIRNPKEVRIESPLAKTSSTRPDYRFLVDGSTKFYVEAKKPSVKLTDPTPIFQAKSYGFSSKVPLVILTDFEEFRPFRTLARPKFDRPLEGVIKEFDLAYDKYVGEFDRLYDVFSRDAVASGELEKQIPSGKKEASQTVDKEFLNDLSGWQEELAKNIAIRNTHLKVHEINEAVQRILDRMIFLRICEDRRIEEKEILLSHLETEDIYRHLQKEFLRLRAKYNGLIFNEHKLSEQLIIDDKILKGIIKNLYLPYSPYRFNEIPIEILGTIYEQFLGKVITLTPTHRAKVEVKPEVRKAGGVFYTPQFITSYIVKNTVGKLIDEKTPEQIVKLKFADIACGSGSFLLEMFDCLISYHIDYYQAHPDKIRSHESVPDAYRDEQGLWHLSTRKKKEILLNNIYGVDIDPQAVEVTQMSLFLKMLENENAETFSRQMTFELKETILPNLSNNIKCGNSLIGTDIMDGQDLFGNQIDMLKIRPFDWATAFPEIIKEGGFDAIIGNPPYIRIQVMKEFSPVEVEHYKTVFQTAQSKNYDIYVAFVEKGISLIKQKGNLGFILPNKFTQQEYGEKLRQIILEAKLLKAIVNFKDQQVFDGATTYTCLLFLSKENNQQFNYFEIDDLKVFAKDSSQIKSSKVSLGKLSKEPWVLSGGEKSELLHKLGSFPKLESITSEIFVGLQTSADKILILDLVEQVSKNRIKLFSKAKQKAYTFETEIVKPIISGQDVKRFGSPKTRQYVIFPYKIINDKAILIDEKEIKGKHEHTFEYLFENKKELENRENGKMRGFGWYGYIYLKNMNKQELRKLCVPRLVQRIQAIFDEHGDFYLDNVDVGGVTLTKNDVNLYKYVLGLLNSSLLTFYLRAISTPFRGGFYSCNKQYLSQLPIRLVDITIPKEKQMFERVIQLVDRMISLNTTKRASTSDSEKEIFDTQIKATDHEIDELVYKLYGLTEDEIKIVEGN